jgi:hypothetical protein
MSSPRFLLGDAPRFLIHALCARPNEIVLGTCAPLKRRCSRCQDPIRAGVVVQAPAKREVYRTHQAK